MTSTFGSGTYRGPLGGLGAPPPRRLSRVGRIALAVAFVCLVPAVISYVSMLTQRSDSSLGIRTVEWLRDNGARGLVTRVESIYYAWTAPAKGGPGLRALPHQAGAVAGVATPTRARASVRHRHVRPAYTPPRIRPILHPALPGEGVWHATWAGPGSTRPPVLITSFRPNPDYPRVVADVAWIDHTRTTTWLYPGVSEPAVALPARGPEEVPFTRRNRLVATFNSGFKLRDAGGGFVYGGHTFAPLAAERATFVRYRNGRVDIVSWDHGSVAPPDVEFARQNLPLLVNHGRPNPDLSNGPEWGATLGNKAMVWRSALGVDRHGNLIYTAAPDMTTQSLATVMVHAGAVRAMELDINTYWTSFITYRAPGALGATNLDPSMDRSPERYLSPDDRDFFAVYLK
jgi:hypothetical protein